MVRPMKSSSGQLPPTNHTTVARCCHCDGEVVIPSTNGNLVLITHLLSLSKIRALLRAFYTIRYIDDAKGWLYFWEVRSCFTIWGSRWHINGCCGQWSQSLARSLAYGSGKPECSLWGGIVSTDCSPELFKGRPYIFVGGTQSMCQCHVSIPSCNIF